MPFVDAEVERLTLALRGVSTRLSVALRALSDADRTAVGPRSTQARIESGWVALADALGALRTVAEDAAAVTARHAAPLGGVPASGTADGPAGPSEAGSPGHAG